MSSPVYRHVDDIDLYVGGFLEKAHEDSILGPVFKCIIGDQFARLKKGDRFFYDLNINNNIAFTLPQLEEVSVVRILPWQNYINSLLPRIDIEINKYLAQNFIVINF